MLPLVSFRAQGAVDRNMRLCDIPMGSLTTCYGRLASFRSAREAAILEGGGDVGDVAKELPAHLDQEAGADHCRARPLPKPVVSSEIIRQDLDRNSSHWELL